MGATSHKDLIVYQKSIDLVVLIYQVTDSFPVYERYGLTNQLRRAAVSVPSNIAEGAGRSGAKEFRKFLYISLGSLNEVETQLEIALRLKYIQQIDDLLDTSLYIKRMLLKLIRNLEMRG